MASMNDIETKVQNIFDILDCRSVSTITGTLPMTFKADGTALVNYRIYGVAEGAGVETENIVNVESTVVGSRIIVNTIQNSTGTVWATTSGGADYIDISFYPVFELGKTYTISFNNLYTKNTKSQVTIRKKSNYQIRYSSRLTNYGKISFSFTYTAAEFPNGAYLSIILNDSTAIAGEVHIENLMIIEGNTDPKSFIPFGYKIPITVTKGLENKMSDIFIGDIKLGAADYVDYETQTITRGGISEPAPLPLPALETYIGTNTLDSTETLGEVTIKGKIKEVI